MECVLEWGVESFVKTEFDMKKVLMAVWQFCSYVFGPLRGNSHGER